MSAGLVAPTFTLRLLRRQGRRWRRPTGHGEESTRVRRSHLDYSLVRQTGQAPAARGTRRGRPATSSAEATLLASRSVIHGG